MSDLGKKIAGLFVKQEEPSTVPAAAAPAEEAEESVAPARSSRAGSAARGSARSTEDAEVSEGGLDQGILASLEEALASKAPKDYGYQQFRSTLDKMKKKTPNEAARFTAALAAAEAMGCTSAKIVASANEAIEVLKGEQGQFKKEIAELNKADEAKAAELKDVEDQIKALTSKQTKLNKELQASATNIQDMQQRFQTTFKGLVSEINTDIDKVNEYSSK